jgi:hypothetical protein
MSEDRDRVLQGMRQGTQQQMQASQTGARDLAAQTERGGQAARQAFGSLGEGVRNIATQRRAEEDQQMRREQLDLQRKQAEQGMEIQQAQEARAASMHPYATEEVKQRLARGELTMDEQRMRAEIAQAENDFMNQPATDLALPGAMPGQTVREYQLAAQAEQNAVGLQELNQRLEIGRMDIAQRLKTDPLQVKALAQGIEERKANMALAQLNKRMTLNEMNAQQRAQNQANVANVLLEAASLDMQRGDPNMTGMRSKAEAFRSMGMDEADIAAGLNNARQQMSSQKAQQAMVNMADPRYQRRIREEMKAERWLQVKRKMQAIAQQVGDYVGDEGQRAQLESLQQDFVALGKPHMAKYIAPFIKFDGVMPTTRSHRIKEAIKMVDQEILAGLSNPSGLGSSIGMPATQNLYQSVSSGGWGLRTTQPTPNLFQGLGNVDASQLGGPQ